MNQRFTPSSELTVTEYYDTRSREIEALRPNPQNEWPNERMIKALKDKGITAGEVVNAVMDASVATKEQLVRPMQHQLSDVIGEDLDFDDLANPDRALDAFKALAGVYQKELFSRKREAGTAEHYIRCREDADKLDRAHRMILAMEGIELAEDLRRR